MKESDSGRWSGNGRESGSESAKGSENGRGSEKGRGSVGGQDLEVETDTGMEAARPPIAQDVTAPLVPEKKAEIGIEIERGNIDTRTGTARAPTLTGTKGRGPPETDHLTPATESARCPRSHVKREEDQERAGATTRRITETGRTGRGPPPRIRPGAGNERDPCRWSGTDAPAQRSESQGRYEQKGRESREIRTGGGRLQSLLIWIYCLVKGAWRDECRCECVCVSFVCVFMFKMGHVH